MEIKQLYYHHRVVKEDIPALDAHIRTRCKTAIEQKLAVNPLFWGKPLQSTLKCYRVFRVGSYRIVYRLENHGIYIVVIAHRSKVYKAALKREVV